MSNSRIFSFIACIIFMLSTAIAVSAQSEAEKSFLSLYFTEDELKVVSATRSLKSIDRIAENISVITHEDIELMNAHTVADVLNSVNGVQVMSFGSSPGNIAVALIQGSDNRHVAVFLDGVPLNNLSNNLTGLDMLPVQYIEKIEIIKGPASSAWGSSLGGVVNIITKSASDKVSGTLSASYGERETSDLRAEISGRKDAFGFYAAAGRLETDGFRQNNDTLNKNIYTKLSFDPASNTRILFSLLYNETLRGEFVDPDWGEYGKKQNKLLVMNLSLDTALSKEADLSVSLWSYDNREKEFTYQLSDSNLLSMGPNRDNKYCASGKFSWRHENHALVIGTDYEKGTLWSNVIENDKQSIEKWALYFNDTLTFGKLSLTPGLRYDRTDTNGGFLSPSLGATYDLGKKTLLRAYVARGFSIPPLSFTFLKEVEGWRGNPDLKVEKVMSYQLGMETGLLEYVWLKIAAFRHDLTDGIILEEVTPNVRAFVNRDKLRRQGIELEMKTLSVYNMTLQAGATFIETENSDTGDEIRDSPKSTYIMGLQYDDKKSFRALLQGRYTWWNMESWHLAKYSSMIVDLNMIKTVYQGKGNKVDLFLTGHNIFNGSQYFDSWYKNASRWVEAGLRYRF